MPKKSFVLVDGSYYLFRAYHAMPALTNSTGEPTGAIFGVINMIHKLFDAYNPDYFAVIFDAKGKTFRNDIYPDYKANRPPMPDELSCQIEPLHKIIRAEGFPLLMIDNVEADDVLATLAKAAERSGIKTIISTGDKDLAQIVNKDINLINTMTNNLLDIRGVKEKFGVPPELIIDYLALVGDAVDNVPGVYKVGPKTAVKWINEYGSLDKIIDNAKQISGKVGENLRASLDQVGLSKELVTLRSDLKLNLDILKLKRQDPDYSILSDSYKHWGFNSWLAKLPTTETQNTADTRHHAPINKHEVLFTAKDLDRWCKLIEKSHLISFDTETTSLDYMNARLVGISFSVDPYMAAYIPLTHDYPDAPSQLHLDHVLKKLKPILASPNIKKLGHNLKYDMHILANYKIELYGIKHDSMLESYILDSSVIRHDMDSLALKYLKHETTHYEDVAGKGAKKIPFNQVKIEAAAPYAAEDADITLRLHQFLWPKLSGESGLKEVYEEIEIPLTKVLFRIERNGVLVDEKMLKTQSIKLNDRMVKIEQHSQDIAGEIFNISSPKQVQTILYDKLNLPILSKTPKGQPSTAESVLQELAHGHELPELILEYRMLNKLKTTYTDRLPEQVNKKTGRIHTSYHQAVTTTGRLSSTDPNLQNIPVKSEEGRKIREAFIAPPGYAIVAADYSQIELRIMAHLSGDSTLISSFLNNEDIHKTTAAEIFSVNIQEVNADQRRSAKAINFGLIYGMSPFGLSRQLGIEIKTAKKYVDRYFERYPAIKSYMDNIRQKAKADGYVETVFKRRLYLPEINSQNATRRQYAERTAINGPMQGTAADLIKRAMIQIDREIIDKSDKIKMIMQVHDELVFEIEESSIDNMANMIKSIMSSAPEISVPIVVEVGVGPNWEQAH